MSTPQNTQELRNIGLIRLLVVVTGVLDVLVSDVLPLPLSRCQQWIPPSQPRAPGETYTPIPVVPKPVHPTVEATMIASAPNPRLRLISPP